METNIKIGLTTEVKKVSKDIDEDFSYSPILYKKKLMQLEMSKSNERVEEKCKRHLVFCPSTLYQCGIVFLASIFLFCLAMTVVSHGTDTWDTMIKETLVLRNNTTKYRWWSSTPIRPVYNIRLFNYTNVDAFMRGRQKLRVEEIGPFAYRERLERVNVKFNPNGTVTFQEKRTYEYLPELSNGSLTDILEVPNMVLLSASSMFKEFPYFVQMTFKYALMSIDVQPFVKLSVNDYLWGYEDALFTMTKGMPMSVPIPKLGIMALREGTSPKKITIHTGEEDLSRLGVIQRFQGQEKLSMWGSDQCNRIDGTDGSGFPPQWMGENQTIYVYMADLCRKFPFVFKERLEIFGGVPANRYHAPRDVFGHYTTNHENSCFCNKPSCPPAGVFNMAPCIFNIPIAVSFPHFYLGDPILLQEIRGLNPQEEKHDMYLDIHPKFGFPMAGSSRFQMNLMVKKSEIADLKYFSDNAIIPVSWFEVIVEELPEEMMTPLYHMTFTRRTLECAVPIVMVFTGLILAAILIRELYRQWSAKRTVSDVYRTNSIMMALPIEKSDNLKHELC